MEGIYLSSASYLLLAALALIMLAVVGDLCRRKFKTSGSTSTTGIKAPGPRPWPLIGSLHLLGGYDVPYKAFDVLSAKYGPVFSIKLGQVQCLVVSSLEYIREVLVTKGDHFDGRPNFTRYHQLFSGNKQNSLAFSDWSEMQKTRREMLRDHTFPRAFTARFQQLDTLLNEELLGLCTVLRDGVTDIKPLLLQSCANVFMAYFCSVKFSSDDEDFVKMVRNFDEIFFEVNQGYAADFLPWLLPLHSKNLTRLRKWSHEIREFMETRVINKRLDSWINGQEQEDYVDALIDHVKSPNATMSLETALFALEDIVGGHSAVANLIVKILGFIAFLPDIQKRIQDEVDAVSCGKDITLADRTHMPYTEAVVLEAIRHISSPIVPHVANQTSTVAGYKVEKDTLIFLNNYTLNMSTELWTEPEKFAPERFLSEDGRLIKPEHFLPFGGGRRSCMGYKMTQFVSFATLATILQRFTILPLEYCKVPLGNLALPYETMKFRFHPR
uniref:Putative cytochrome p450 307a1-like protein n=1 Tax=Triatoma dimidiata TaxID=72491 RepID=A0A0V0G3J2_TRIDM